MHSIPQTCIQPCPTNEYVNLLEWNDGMEWWSGLLEWSTAWTGVSWPSIALKKCFMATMADQADCLYICGHGIQATTPLQ